MLDPQLAVQIFAAGTFAPQAVTEVAQPKDVSMAA